MSLRHIVLFRFADDATEEQIGALSDGLDALPGKIDQIRSYAHGPDADISPTSWDYGLVAEFDSAEDVTTYRNHPAHQALLRDVVEPLVAERASVQLPVGDLRVSGKSGDTTT